MHGTIALEDTPGRRADRRRRVTRRGRGTSVTRVLVVDDEPHLLRALAMNLSGRGYDVSTASSATVALAQIRRQPPDLLVLDLGLPDLDGLDVIREVREYGPELPIIVLSARSGSPDKVAALDLGAVDYVTKPFNMDELLARLRAVIVARASRQPGCTSPSARLTST